MWVKYVIGWNISDVSRQWIARYNCTQ